MPKLRITYNAPVVLTFALAAVLVHVLTGAFGVEHQGANATRLIWFASHDKFYDTASYVGLFSHILGHANWQHLLANFTMILLIGPILEERHGSLSLLVMILITALITGLINVTIGDGAILGASGIVFMMILLASTANIREGELPLTFIAVAVVYLGGEIYRAVTSEDGVSQMGHLIGGVAGALFGFLGARAKHEAALGKPLLPAAKVKSRTPR